MSIRMPLPTPVRSGPTERRGVSNRPIRHKFRSIHAFVKKYDRFVYIKKRQDYIYEPRFQKLAFGRKVYVPHAWLLPPPSGDIVLSSATFEKYISLKAGGRGGGIFLE